MIKPAPDPSDNNRDLRVEGNALITAIARSLADGASASTVRVLGNELDAVRTRLTSLDEELREALASLSAEKARTARLSKLEETLAQLEQTRGELQACDTDKLYRIAELEQLLSAAEKTRAEYEVRDRDRVARIGHLEQNLSEVEQVRERLQTRDNDRVSRIGELEQLLAAVEQAREHLQTLDRDHVARIGELEQRLATVNEAHAALHLLVAERAARVTEFESVIGQQTARLARVERALTAERQLQREVESRNDAQAAQIKTLEAEAAAHAIDARRLRGALETAQSELQTERAARAEVAGAAESRALHVGELERALANAEANSSKLASENRRLEAERAEMQRRVEEVRLYALDVQDTALVQLTKATDEIDALEHAWAELYTEFDQTREHLKQRNVALAIQADKAAKAEDWRRSVEAELICLRSSLAATQADEETIDDLRALLSAANQESEDARQAVETLRIGLAAARDEVVEAKGHADSLTAQLSVVKVQLAYSERKHVRARELESEMDAIRSASLADRAVMEQYVQTHRDRVEQLETRLRAESSRLANSEREARGVREHLETTRRHIAEVERQLHDENHELRARVKDAEHALAAQVDANITRLQAESTQLTTLVDAVQSSHFWRLKRWLNRLRGRASTI